MNNYKTKYGYFANKGREYVITRPDTPMPWVNVICPGDYGVIISQTGGGYSWLTHAGLNRITRWQQDLLTDNDGKYLFIVDEENGEIWSVSWMPVKRKYEFYNCIHGLGYTKFINKTNGIKVEMTVFVPPAADISLAADIPPGDNLEIWKVKIVNESGRNRHLKIISYLEWCLGTASSVEHRELHNLFIETKVTKDKEILATKRVWSIEKKGSSFFNHPWEYVAYHFGNPEPSEYLLDRRGFIGRLRDLSNPLLSGFRKFTTNEEISKWDEPIGSLSWELQLAPGEKKNLEIFIGVEKEEKSIRRIKNKYFNHTEDSYKKTLNYWEKLLSPTYIETPDDGFNYLMNYWLKYQTISARLNGRTGYYQTGGAFGFRDQLQDSQIYFKLNPQKARERILIHASRQYNDGAVQHWWHPITDTGLRNDISDNLLWLPFITQRYIMETGDYDILGEKIAYIDDGEDKLLDHCEKAIERVLSKRSERGIPLIGEGDWNDGLSAAGSGGKGESIWLGHFLTGILRVWSQLKEVLGDKEKAVIYDKNADDIMGAINKFGWDGEWYIRATTDSGKVLGSQYSKGGMSAAGGMSTAEGKIFLNAQTWSVLSKTVPDKKIPLIQKSLEKYLYRKYGPILLHPAYKKSDVEIGYLSRYAPGVRENGGLYFHAACWAVAAECEMKRPEKVEQLLNSFLPPNRSLEPELYRCEPYVLPGNVDGPDSPHFGRGGWTWYTGAAAWLFTVGWDWIIGLKPTPEGFKISPCVPLKWKEVKGYRYFRGKKIEFIIINSGREKVEIKANEKILKNNILNIREFKEVKVIKLAIKC